MLKRAIISSATFTILPSISILLGVIALSGTLGVPFSWLRLSVIGALQYELNVAEIAAQSIGLSLSLIHISGGEAQKIALARALYKDAPFIILDEPTAALDPIAEYGIYSGFEKLVGGKSAVYISHRLSSCRFCDDIAVFEEGRLVQSCLLYTSKP